MSHMSYATHDWYHDSHHDYVIYRCGPTWGITWSLWPIPGTIDPLR